MLLARTLMLRRRFLATLPHTPWHNFHAPKPCIGLSFSAYDTQFRPSAIPDGGLGWWALMDIPAGVMLRHVAVADGSLHRVANEPELRSTGWDVDEAVHYGIGHKADHGAIYYLDPGTAANHADPTRSAAVEYIMRVPGEMQIRTIRDVKAGEEMFIDYASNFVPVDWFDALCEARGLTPLSKLGGAIDAMYSLDDA